MEPFDFEDFELYSPKDRGQKKSRLHALREAGAFIDCCVFDCLDTMTAFSEPVIAAFFQIPYPVFLRGEYFRIAGKEYGVKIDIKFTALFVDFASNGSPRISTDNGTADFVSNATQVSAIVPLWGKRAEFYERYTNSFTPSGVRVVEVANREESWIKDTPINTFLYESDLSKRIIREIKYSCRHVLKAYSIETKRRHYDDQNIYNYFTMPFPGRVCTATDSTSILSPILSRFARKPVSGESIDRVRKAIPSTYRQTSRFEKQLFAITELIDGGHHAIALVSCLTLVEWLLKYALSGHIKGHIGLNALLHSIKIDGWSDCDYERIDDLRKLRNKIVHMGEQISATRGQIYEVTDLEIDREITENDAKKAVLISWELFQLQNSNKIHLRT